MKVTNSVSIIIVTHKRVDSLINTLSSVLSSALLWGNVEIIVVDNSGDDEIARSVSMLCELYSNQSCIKVTFLSLSEKSKSISLNLAVSISSGEWLLFTDDDVRVPIDWVSRMVTFALERNCKIVCGGVSLTADRILCDMKRVHYECLACTDLTPWDASYPAIGANCLYHNTVYSTGLSYCAELSYGTRNAIFGEDLYFWLQARRDGFVSIANYDITVEHYPSRTRFSNFNFCNAARSRGRYDAYIGLSFQRRNPLRSLLRSLTLLLLLICYNPFIIIESRQKQVPSEQKMKLFEYMGAVRLCIDALTGVVKLAGCP